MSEDFSVKVNAEIRRALKEAGLTQRELGRRMGVTEARICQMLNSRGNLTLASIDRIFSALGYAAIIVSGPLPAVDGS